MNGEKKLAISFLECTLRQCVRSRHNELLPYRAVSRLTTRWNPASRLLPRCSLWSAINATTGCMRPMSGSASLQEPVRSHRYPGEFDFGLYRYGGLSGRRGSSLLRKETELSRFVRTYQGKLLCTGNSKHIFKKL